MDGLRQDLRYALRQIGTTPVLSAVTLLVLTLGIGTSAVVLSVLDGILFRAPPGVGSVEGLVEIRSMSTSGPASPTLTYREFLAYREQRSVFEETAVYRTTRVALEADGVPKMVSAELASSGYFAVLDVPMALGAGFAPGDDRSTGDPAHAVLGHAYWQRSLGGSEAVLGRRIEVNGRPYTVIGVAPERFYGAGGGDDPVTIWLPASDDPLLFPSDEGILGSDRRGFGAVARLAEGVTVHRAETATQATWNRVARSSVGLGPVARRIEVTPYRGVGSRQMSSALAFVGVVGGLVAGLVLLIACANASGLLLSGALARRREIGVRLAIGGRRRRIVRQLLTESLLIASLGGTAGVVLTWVILDSLERTLFTFPIDLAPSLTILGLTVGVTAATGVVFGLTPALHATNASVLTALRDDVAGSGRRGSRLRDGFTVAQLALSLPRLTAAALLALQLVTSQAGAGFSEPEGILSVDIDLRHSGYTPTEVDPVLSQILERATALPGISSAAFAKGPPFVISRYVVHPQPTASDPDPGERRARTLTAKLVDPQYFETMGIPILRGRPLASSDVAGAPLVTVVDRQVARRLWPDQSPLGRTWSWEAARKRHRSRSWASRVPSWKAPAGLPASSMPPGSSFPTRSP